MSPLLSALLALLAAQNVFAAPQAATFVTTTTASSVTSVTSITTSSPSSTTTSTVTSSAVSTASVVSTVSSAPASSSTLSSSSSSLSASSSSSTPAPPPTPAGGLGISPTDVPVYSPMSDWDFQSLNLALMQEYLELDLFHNGLARFSPQEFEAAGINSEQQFLIQYMADQEVGHAEMITNILGPDNASKPCTYAYPYNNVRDFIDFSNKITRIGESGVLGFLAHLNSRAAANLLSEAITVESRQEMVLRQMEGLFPMPQWFNPVITQSMQWTQMAPWILSCPAQNPRIEWQIFPGLNITNAPNASAITNETLSAVSHNRTTPLSSPGQLLHLQWEAAGKSVGPNMSYTTASSAGAPRFAAWISQLNVTYTPLINVTGFTAFTQQPGGEIYGPGTAGTVNGTMFVLITDDDPFITSFNGTLLNQHVVAGPAAYIAG